MSNNPLEHDKLLAPHSHEAEEALLGSILINPNTYYETSAIVTADDFFVLRNRWVWEAYERLYRRGEVAEYLLVMNELKAREQLDLIGGASYLGYLITQATTWVYADAYAVVVSRMAQRRRLLEAANEIAQLARAEELDIHEVIGRSETVFFSVTERQLRKDTVHIEDVARNLMEMVDDIVQNGKSAGIPSGYHGMDELLGGFQKSDLLVLAARPGMGKTALMLNVTLNAARAGAKVAFFSLEMNNEQLLQRLIASETGINTHKLRTAKLHDDREWSLFYQSIANISELPIFLDDAPSLSVNQLRSKCRRMNHEHKLDFVVVDYLQLMVGSEGSRNENRVQEISFISRGLKELARELNIPVLAGSQLSRAVEQRTDKRPVLSDLRESGCLTGESLITLADTGENVPIRDLIGKSGFAVWGLNQETYKLERATVSNAFSTGIKPVYKLTTQLGRSIRATANHPFLTICGWKRLDELQAGDYIAVPRHLPSPYEQTMRDAELALLGHLIGDGCTLPRHAIQYTTREADLAETLANLATEVFGDQIKPIIKRERQWYQVYLSATQRLTHGVRNPISTWLEDLGVFGLRSHEKFIPEKVFQQPPHAIAIFLRHLWATDGCIKLVKGSKTRPIAYYASSRIQLSEAVQSLLIRLGINARIKRVSQKNKGLDQYQVIITGAKDLLPFIQEIGAVGAYKQNSVEDIAEYYRQCTPNPNRDVIPSEVWHLYAIPSMKQHGVTTRQLHSSIGIEYCGTTLYKQNMSRERALRVADAVQSQELRLLSESDIYWDQISGVEGDGEEEVFDLTVPSCSNFVSCNIIVHNSIEQDSDIVMFIYRDDVYHEDSERPNEADILIAKHRNGPTGVVPLLFDKELTKFVNMKKTDFSLEDY